MALRNGTSAQTLPRILIIGAGSRGNAYARAVRDSGLGIVAAVAEPILLKRRLLGSKYIWGEGNKPEPDQQFGDYRAWIHWETDRRKVAATGINALPGIDGVFVCVLDEQHREVVNALAPLKLHILCEKPLATTLNDCIGIYASLLPEAPSSGQDTIFSIGHVLRYSPHNMLLRRLVLENEVIGEILSVEHTEPVGWWHFSHSYVRGNWRRESQTAPSLLTKSCHDIDFLLWLLCSPAPMSRRPAHLPSSVTSTGSLKQFRKVMKPPEAGDATNCLQCPIRDTCNFSAPKVYYDAQLARGNTDWPVNIVNPEIEECYARCGPEAAKALLFDSLSSNLDPWSSAPSRPQYGRCVWESDNDVCDDQYVTMTWEDDPIPSDSHAGSPLKGRGAKSAVFHMIAQTEKQCERRGRIYGTRGEIAYDGRTISVYDFGTQQTKLYHPHQPGGGHGGGDDGLARQFVKAIDAVKNHGANVEEAQREHVGCTLEEIIRSHAIVFAAEEARRERKVVDWPLWWGTEVQSKLKTWRADGTPSPVDSGRGV